MRRRPSEHYVVEQILAGAGSTDPETVDHLRDRMYAEVDAFALACGYAVLDLAWDSVPEGPILLGGFSGSVRLRLDATIVARVDGEWPSIRAAVEEDRLALRLLQPVQWTDPPHREPPPAGWMRIR